MTITDEEIVGTALEVGFMLSTQYGQAESDQMPVSDTATLRVFAERFYQLGSQHQRDSDAALCMNSEIPFGLDVWLGSTKKEMTARTAIALAEAIRNNTGDLK